MHHKNPILEAAGVYQREPCRRTFQQDLDIHLTTGYVVSTPEYFIMARPVNSGAPQEDVVNPMHIFDNSECDCWHIYLMAGDMKKCWDKCPDDLKDLPLVSFERSNVLKFLPMDRVKRLVLGC
jgi:hypothetical protein